MATTRTGSRATGIDWEVHDPRDPWSHIGYWGDHQIVYLHRLLDAWERHEPGALRPRLGERVSRSRTCRTGSPTSSEILADPRAPITFDEARTRRSLAARGPRG